VDESSKLKLNSTLNISTLELTEDKIKDLSAQVTAINKTQAIIEFNLDGTILTANNNFLNAIGYNID